MFSTRGITKNKRIYIVIVRSDRINALRKQYDAFLEEDKKRKERNEFILGRLDKMRYTTALVPMRHKFQPSTFETRSGVVDHQLQISPVRDFQPCMKSQNLLIPNIPITNIEDTYLIQEISKKYILIPKVRSTFTNNYIRTPNQNMEKSQVHSDQEAIPVKDFDPTSSENTDWKSKYEILNILKKEENEKLTGNYATGVGALFDHTVRKDSVLENNQNHNIAIHHDNNANSDLNVESAINGGDQFPEKDLPPELIDYELPKDFEYTQNTTVGANLIPNTISECNKVLEANHDQTGAIGNALQNITYNLSDTPNIEIPEELTNYEHKSISDANVPSTNADVCFDQTSGIINENINIEDEIPVAFDSLKIHDQNVPVEKGLEQIVYEDDDEVSDIQVCNSDTLVNEFNYNAPTIPSEAVPILESETATKISNVQDFEPNKGIQMKTDVNVVPEEQTDLNSNNGTLEQAETVVEHTENQVNISESIDDFDAEQREMFYTEQTDDNYANQQGDVATPYDLEYSQNEYSHNQEYAYYENTEAAAYPAESTDEVVTQQYDQNYEQQYAEVDQVLEQQQYVEQYEEPARGTNQADPEFETLQYEQEYESQGKIEETLDAEEGYVMQPHDAQAIEIQPDVEVPEIEKTDAEKIPVSE